MNQFATLENDRVSIVVDLRHSAPKLMHIGARVPGDPIAQAMALDSAVPLAGLNGFAPRTILPEASRGFPARPGIEGHRSDGSSWAPRMEAVDVAVTPDSVLMTSVDEMAGLSQQVGVALDASGVVKIWATLTNTATSPYQLDGLTMCVPLPSSAREAMQLGGRWSNEFRAERRLVATGALEVENRAGRTSHDRFPALFVGDEGFSEERGEVLAAHLAWSGNSRLRVESLSDGRRVLQVGDALLPGEIQLAAGETYTSPVLYLAWSNAGLNGISDCFHPYMRGARRTLPRTGRCCSILGKRSISTMTSTGSKRSPTLQPR